MNLSWLPTHKACNGAFKKDEEYFVAVLSSQACESETGQAVWNDYASAVRKGHDVGLTKTVIQQFGQVTLPDGRIPFVYDSQRLKNVLWKLIRGVHFQMTGTALEASRPRAIDLFTPGHAAELDQHGWYQVVRDTQPLGEFENVFDIKTLGIPDGDWRGHAYALLIWDRIIALALFHDPSCGCGECGHEPQASG